MGVGWGAVVLYLKLRVRY